jgi:putative isomerase
MPVEAPDLNTYLCIQQQNLGEIAAAIGEDEDAKMWTRRADELTRSMIKFLWDDQAGVFWARRNGQRVNVLTPFNLFPLLTGRMPAEIAGRLVARLTDKTQFWPRYPVPSVALNDPKYNPNEMWRGPTWVNINYLIIEGLQKAGYPEIARELRHQTLELISGHQE